MALSVPAHAQYCTRMPEHAQYCARMPEHGAIHHGLSMHNNVKKDHLKVSHSAFTDKTNERNLLLV